LAERLHWADSEIENTYRFNFAQHLIDRTSIN